MKGVRKPLLHPHSVKGIYYNIGLKGRGRQRGWLLDSRELVDIVHGIADGHYIDHFDISAHHGTRNPTATNLAWYVHGAVGEPGLDDQGLADLVDSGKFAKSGRMVLRMCNGQTVAPTLKVKLGRGWTVVYTIGTNTNIPGTDLDIPRWIFERTDGREKGEVAVNPKTE